jgi:DNA-binding NarL/FixJ family response regulator
VTIRVVVADDHAPTRLGVRMALEDGGFEVVHEAATGPAAVAAVLEHSPDVALLDVHMPGDGIAAARAISSRLPQVAVVMLTVSRDDGDLFQALRAGARGYLLKDVTLAQLVGAIRALAAGSTLVQPALTDRLLRAIAAPEAHDEPFAGLPPPQALTPRELEILRLLAGGYANREIAAALHLAEGTVKNHVSHLLLKLGVRDRTRAVLRALHEGLLAPPVTPPQ